MHPKIDTMEKVKKLEIWKGKEQGLSSESKAAKSKERCSD
jgi:hypothetical protein